MAGRLRILLDVAVVRGGIFRRDVRGVIRVVGGGGVSRGGEWCLDS